MIFITLFIKFVTQLKHIIYTPNTLELVHVAQKKKRKRKSMCVCDGIELNRIEVTDSQHSIFTKMTERYFFFLLVKSHSKNHIG